MKGLKIFYLTIESASCVKIPRIIQAEALINKNGKNKDSNMKNACQIFCKVCKLALLILLIFGPTNAW